MRQNRPGEYLSPFMDILPQIILIAIISSAVYALISTGLTLTFGVLEFINFAHGEMAMAGAFLFYTLHIQLGLSLIISLVLTVLGVALIGIIIEKTTFKPVRNKHAFIPLILSIGISIILQSLVIIFFGAGSKTYQQTSTATNVHHFFNNSLIITNTQILIIITPIILITLIYFFLKKTKTGKAIRAVADNKEVAAIMGIDVNKSISILFALASGLTAIAGILIAFDQNLHPRMGLLISVKAFAAIIIGGVGKLKGAVVGAIIIAFAETLLIGLTPLNSSYKDTIAFTILIIVLLIKPYGLFGGRKEEVESR